MPVIIIVGMLDHIKAELCISKPNISQTILLSNIVKTNNGSKSFFSLISFFLFINSNPCGIRERPRINSNIVKNRSLSVNIIIPGTINNKNGEISNSSFEKPFPFILYLIILTIIGMKNSPKKKLLIIMVKLCL